MRIKFTLMMLAGLLTVQTMTAQEKESVNDGRWQDKVSPLLCNQISQAKVESRRAPGKEMYLGALVKLNEGRNGYVLRKEGSVLLDSLDQFYIALLPASRIQAMVESGNVEVIEAHEKGKIQMDVTHKTIGADKVQAGTPSLNIPAYTGKGVVVGISDNGLDYTHPMFRNADGTMAIKKAWDAYADNSNGYGGLGAIYETKEAMLAAEGSMDRTITHGTHVMGIAAGRPWKAFDSENKEVTFRGIAYDADIVATTAVCDTDVPSIDEMMRERINKAKKEGVIAEVMNAGIMANDIYSTLSIKLIFDYAKEHNQPCVVNCSWGSTETFTDRNSAMDEFIGKMVGPGRILVASAGNQGDSYIYLEKPEGQKKLNPNILLRDSTSGFTMHCDEEFTMGFDIYSVEDMTTPQYSLIPALTSQNLRKLVDQELYIYEWDYTDNNGVNRPIYLKYGYLKNPNKGYDYMVTLQLPKEYFEKKLYYVDLNLSSNGKIRLQGTPDKMVFGKNNNLNYHTVGWPGTSPYALCVGIISHRNWVSNIYGKQTYASDNSNDEGYAVNWSSCGPTLDGALKPEVMAPGYNIVSARSKLYKGGKEWNEDNLLVVASNKDGNETREVVLESGTSMASPVVTGIVALWLQAKPTLTREQILETIIRTSKHPDTDMEYPNYIYGYGEIDAYAGLLDILGIKTNIPTLSNKLASVTMKGRTLCIEGATEPVTVHVYSLSGQLVFTGATTDGQVTLPSLPAAVYAVQAGKIGSTLIRL